MGLLATVLGWIAVVALALAGGVPLVVRWRAGKRGAPDAPPLRVHAGFGLTALGASGAHLVLVVPRLGLRVGDADDLGLATAAGAFLLLVLHAGFGRQLQNPKLKTRLRVRRTHAFTALLVVLGVALHVVR